MSLFSKRKENIEVQKPIGTFTEKDLRKPKPEIARNELSENADNYVVLKNIHKIYNKKVHAVVDFNLVIKQREFVVFVGPSGCGKSTTLRMIAGLEEISSGELYIDGMHANDMPPKDRDIAMVFQNYSLYPNMTVYDNLAFSLKVKHLPKEEIDARVKNAAKILEISDYLDRKPSQLSGGQRQRVALGKSIVRQARVFLMDEPLSNLDAKLRVQMRAEIIKLHKQVKATTIYVTHDQTEAMTMADRIVVMRNGFVQQIGTPLEIYRHPVNQFVASFIGSPAMNFIDSEYENGTILFKDGTKKVLDKEMINRHDEYYQSEEKRLEELIPNFIAFLEKEHSEQTKKFSLKKKEPFDINQDKDLIKLREHLEIVKSINKGQKHEIRLGIRPEYIKYTKKSTPNSFKAEVIFTELLGEQYYVHFKYGGEEIIASVFSESDLENSKVLDFEMDDKKIHMFDYLVGKTIF